MNTSVYEIVKGIKARQKAAFFNACAKADNKKEITDITKKFLSSVLPSLPKMDKATGEKVFYNLIGCGRSVWSVNHAENMFDYLASYAEWKAKITETFNDYGAFADLVETCVHAIVNLKIWRVNLRNLHVSAIGNIDVRFRGNRFEVGTNGKNWMESTESDYMNGKFDGVIYGMFDDDDKEMILNNFINGDILGGLTTICNFLYVWENKYDYLDFMQGISRKPSITWWEAQQIARVRYNPSKIKAFTEAINNSYVPNLGEYITRFGESDFYKG